MPSLIVFLFGSMTGSFLNVCILRMPKEESVVFPRSHCLSCKKTIAWFDNLPILSFLVLGAKCRHCRAKISWQYPIIEIITAVLFVVFYRSFSLSPKGFLYLFLSLVLLVQSVIDMRYKIIPDSLTLPTIVVGLLSSAVFPEIHGSTSHVSGFLRSLAGVLVGGGFLYAAGTIAEWVLKKEAMGGGDVKLLAAIGAVIGWRGVLWTIFVSSLVGTLGGLYLRFSKGEELIPYGPYLALGAFLYLFYGPTVMDWYFRSLSLA
jgi:leader peptidase (prepilin peptidase)/N-methyltransferase